MNVRGNSEPYGFRQKVLLPLNRVADWLTVVLDGVIASFFAIILIVTVLQVILRYVFNSSIHGGNEAIEGLFIYTTALGAALAVRKRQHISITFAVEQLPCFARRLIDTLVLALIGGLNAVMIFYSLGWIGKVGSSESPVLRIPEWVYQVSVPVGCGLVILYCLVMMLSNMLEWRSKRGAKRC